jgi:hypothetical protein
MAHKNGMVAPATFSNEIIEVLHMRCHGERSATSATLKGLEHMPLFTQFPGEWCDVPGRCGSAVQGYDQLASDPVFPHDKIGHGILSPSG